jgi:hypothetical protein
MYEVYNEENFRHMQSTVEKVRAAGVDLRRPYDSEVGVFPCRSFNIGHQSVSSPHTDSANLAQGWCSITPLGSFDPKKGGHLVLWDFGLIIEFPPGSTVLIPSALITHSNTPIQKGETRFCIVQYAAGGIFRWAENDCMLEKEWLAKATEEQLQARQAKQDARWDKAAAMFTTLDQLRCSDKSA